MDKADANHPQHVVADQPKYRTGTDCFNQTELVELMVVTPGGPRRMTEACGMRNGAGTRPPSSSGASGSGCRQLGGSPGAMRSARSRATCGSPRGRCGGGIRPGGTEALRSRGPVSREQLSPQQWARLELELRKGPLAHGFAHDQRWTLGRIKTLIGRLFHVGYTIEGTSS